MDVSKQIETYIEMGISPVITEDVECVDRELEYSLIAGTTMEYSTVTGTMVG